VNCILLLNSFGGLMANVYKNTDPENIESYDFVDEVRYYIFYHFLMIAVLTLNAVYYIILLLKILIIAYHSKVVPNYKLALAMKDKYMGKK